MEVDQSSRITPIFRGLPTSTRGTQRVRVSLLGVWSALLFAVSSFSLVAVNKIILTSFSFPSPLSLAFGQMLASVLVLTGARLFGVLTLPPLTLETIVHIQPLPILYLLNALSGLSSTQLLPLPMFTVLRRFSILFTLIGEYLLLSQRATKWVLLSVLFMILGAGVAASGDLTFDLYAYSVISLNNLFTASMNVVSKYQAGKKKLGEYGIVYLNCVLMISPLALLMLYHGDFILAYNYTEWNNPAFLLYFTSSCLMGFVLNYSTFLCTRVNSPLTTTVIGTMKNVFITYIGVILGGDYIYSPLNFIGVSISVSAGILYSVFKLSNL